MPVVLRTLHPAAASVQDSSDLVDGGIEVVVHDDGVEAVRQGLKRASKTLKNVRGAWVEGHKVECDAQGHVKEFRVILKVTFVLED